MVKEDKNKTSDTSLSLTFCSGAGSVTGANFLLKMPAGKILIDCGMIQGPKEAEAHNRDAFIYEPSSIAVLIVTHAHLDHVGRIAKLVKEGFAGRILSTPATKALAELVMLDAVHLLAQSAKRDHVEPLYNENHVDAALRLWQTVEYHQNFDVVPGVLGYFKDAGHILGSAIVELRVQKPGTKESKIVFTGDLGNSPSPVLCDTEDVVDADYMVMESVYGDRNHEPKSDRQGKLKKVILDTFNRKGTLVIPAFSVERTQVLLYEINDLIESKQIPSISVFLDSPLGSKVTAVYHSNTHLFNPMAQERIKGGDDIFDFPRLSYIDSDESSRNLEHNHGAKIIIAGSGMSMGGRVRRHEAEYLPDPNSTILLVGYQPLGTLGRSLQDGAREVTMDMIKVPVRAHVESIFGYSAHKDSDHLVGFVEKTASNVKKVFVVMGEPKASLFLAQRLRDELDVNAVYPQVGKEYVLE